MALAQHVAPFIPFLRRFSRALNGAQESGDRWVERVLRVLIDQPGRFATDVAPRIALYRLFLQVWTDERLRSQTAEGEPSGVADRNLDALAPLPRQAFLLRCVEGFSVDETARILLLSLAQIDDLLMAANQDIALQMSTDALIIEDEPLIADDLEHIVGELGHRLIGVATTVDEAVELTRTKRPGVILADIQLADGSSGIDAVNRILGDGTIPVVFITAFPVLLLTGNGPEPTYLIAKPFEPEAVKAAVSQALFFDRRARRSATARPAH
jgi:CheY-like chemotaxis protein/DNA-directed RNA polymerase specialized sigma24 family protein